METKPQKPSTEGKQTPENFIKDIRRKVRRMFSSEQKILIVMEVLRGEDSVAAICHRLDTCLDTKKSRKKTIYSLFFSSALIKLLYYCKLSFGTIVKQYHTSMRMRLILKL